MKNLTEFIKESLILELSSDAYKNAFDKAKARGDKRAEKFLDAYIRALKSEIPDGDELKDDINKWYKEDKTKYPKLNKIGINIQKDNRYMYGGIDGGESYIILNTITSSEGLTYIPRLKSIENGYTKGWKRFIKKYFDIDLDNIHENDKNYYLLGFNIYDKKTQDEYDIKYFYERLVVSKYDGVKDEKIEDLKINDLPEDIKDKVTKAIKIIIPTAKF
jgi:hypothetical protein